MSHFCGKMYADQVVLFGFQVNVKKSSTNHEIIHMI